MPLIIENGSGMADAESYIDLDYLIDYANKRGLSVVDMTESNIVKGQDYFETSYKFKGTKLKDTQALEFPRLISGEVIYPVRVKSAICELALKSVNVLLEDTGRATIREKVGELEVQYSENSSQEVNYNFVFNLIAPWLDNSSSFNSSIVRTY